MTNHSLPSLELHRIVRQLKANQAGRLLHRALSAALQLLLDGRAASQRLQIAHISLADKAHLLLGFAQLLIGRLILPELGSRILDGRRVAGQPRAGRGQTQLVQERPVQTGGGHSVLLQLNRVELGGDQFTTACRIARFDGVRFAQLVAGRHGTERMQGGVVEPLLKVQPVAQRQFVRVRVQAHDVGGVHVQKTLRRRVVQRLETVAEQRALGEAISAPVGPQEVVGQLLGTVRQEDQRFAVGADAKFAFDVGGVPVAVQFG